MAKAWIDDRSAWKDYPAEVERWKANGKRTAEPKRWQVRYIAPDGSTKSAGRFRTKPEAERARDRTAVEITGGTHKDPKAVVELFGVVCQDWLTSKRGISEGTRENYTDVLTQYITPYWGEWKVSSIEWDHVEEWLTHLGTLPGRTSEHLSPGRIDTIYRVASMAAKRAVRRKLISVNPFTDHEMDRKRRKPKLFFLDHAEVERLAVAAGEIHAMYGTLVRLAAYCGPRFGEYQALAVEHVRGNEVHIVRAYSRLKGGRLVLKETKNYEQRVLPIPSFLRVELAELAKGKAPDALLFSLDGKPFTRAAFTSVWRKAVKGPFCPASRPP